MTARDTLEVVAYAQAGALLGNPLRSRERRFDVAAGAAETPWTGEWRETVGDAAAPCAVHTLDYMDALNRRGRRSPDS
jgi:hypothetical protein